MTAPTNIVELLRRDEGEKLSAYQDHMGFWTIGVGRLIDKRKGGGISVQESEILLNNDLARITKSLDAQMPLWRTLNDARQAVLLSMAFQMGVDGLLGFKRTLAHIFSGNLADAKLNMLKSEWATQTPERAARLAQQMERGVFV